MASLSVDVDPASENPLDVVEQIVQANDWPFERASDQDLSTSIVGAWCEYHIHFSWSSVHQALHLMCNFDARVPEDRLKDAYEILALINAQMWFGHFDLMAEDRVLLYRQGALFPGLEWVKASQQCEQMIELAISECERFYPAFQFVVWGGKSAEEALTAAMLDPVGEA
jgi:hypothetical protein